MQCAIATSAAPAGLRIVLGELAWSRLPAAVQHRFGAQHASVDYLGSFEIVRASLLGRVLAFLCRLIGTPVVPRTGRNVPAIVKVGPRADGVAWDREYRWPGCAPCLVRSTKVIGPDGQLVERLPAGLCMPLDVYERAGVLHFVSRGYYFDFGAILGGTFRLSLPRWLSPGVTHVEHVDEPDGWFRFTMTVSHPVFGEMFFQTGNFRAA